MKHDISPALRNRLLPSAVGTALLFSALLTPASAQVTAFIDVPSGAYYESAAESLLSSGALDREARLRPADLATRAELVKLLVNVNRTPLVSPARPSFSDVPMAMWFFTYFETAAKMNWVRGDGDCYGHFGPCTARPAAQVNRAEAATLLVRVFGLQRFNTAPKFPDNSSNQWYYDNLQIAADNCVLQGDDYSGYVRPDSFMNRAEMVVMFYRATQNLRYARDCGVVAATHISNVSAQSSNSIRISFNSDLRPSVAEVRSHYSVRRVSNGQDIGISSATLLNNGTVELSLNADLAAGTDYSVSVDGLVTTGGTTFNDTARFSSLEQSGSILQITVPTARRIVLTFDIDLNAARAEQVSRYAIARVSGSETISVASASLTGNRTVTLALSSDLSANTPYRVNANALLTNAGVSFNDNGTATFQPLAGELSSVSVASSTKILLTFSSALDPVRAESLSTYNISDGSHSLMLSSVRMTAPTTVELNLTEALLSQRSYVLTVQNMLTSQGVTFNGTNSFIFNAGGTIQFSAQLSGGQEVPPVTTLASGTGTFLLKSDGLQYDITVRTVSGSQVTSGSFRNGLSGSIGSVLQSISFSGNRATGTWNLSVSDRNLLLDGKIYVNVHTTQNPNGEIRGQLHQ